MSKFNLNNIKKSLEMSKSFTLMDNFFNKKILTRRQKNVKKFPQSHPNWEALIQLKLMQGTLNIQIDSMGEGKLKIHNWK